MNKLQLKEYLQARFDLVVENKKTAETIANNKSLLGISPGSADDKCYAWISEYIAMNHKNEKFYFIYYGKKNTVLIWDNAKKSISLRLANGVTQRYNFDTLLKQIKKYLPKSSSHIVFFSCDQVVFEPTSNNKIYILNENNIEQFLSKYFDH